MPRVTPITCSLIAAVIAAMPPTAAQGQDTTYSPWRTRGLPSPEAQTTSRTVSSALDTSYIREAVRGNFTEVALGRLAESRASDSAVKDFGKKMVSDHDAMNQQWGQLAASYKLRIMNPGPDMGEAGKDAVDRLGKLKGSEFDQAYMNEMIQEHQQALDLLQRARNSAQDRQIRRVAETSATTVSEHLTLAQQVGSRVGVATTAGRVGGVTYPTPTTGTYRRPTTTTRPTNPEVTERNERTNLRPLSAEDRRFVDGVLGDHLLHVRLARIAERNAQRKETREFAQEVESQLSNWADRWENFADRHNADVSSHLEQQDRNKIQRLRDAKEKNFDHAYAQIVANHMERMLDNFRKERWDERPDPAGRLAQKELPVLRDLHARANELERKLEKGDKGSDKK